MTIQEDLNKAASLLHSFTGDKPIPYDNTDVYFLAQRLQAHAERVAALEKVDNAALALVKHYGEERPAENAIALHWNEIMATLRAALREMD